jgi:hypothetical protein
MWPWIVINFFVIKPTRCTNFKFILSWNSTCFGQFLCPSSGVYSLYTQQWYMSYRFVDSFRAGSGWNWCLQWTNSWWWTGELSESCRVSCQNKFEKLVYLVSFIINKFNTSVLDAVNTSQARNTPVCLISCVLIFFKELLQLTSSLWVYLDLIHTLKIHHLKPPFAIFCLSRLIL